ncbi:hypothetical protein X979_4724 [Burkholderia pseudomallei MSHR7527]|nr:hypothetical protein X979_4724 [Burkholderia pseudomallei MSHR7527]
MDGAEGGWRGGTQARLAWLAARRHAGGGRCRRTAWACVGGQRGPQRQGKGTQANEPDRRLRRGQRFPRRRHAASRIEKRRPAWSPYAPPWESRRA